MSNWATWLREREREREWVSGYLWVPSYCNDLSWFFPSYHSLLHLHGANMTLIQLHMFTVVLTLTLLATVPGTSALSSSESFGLESIFKANPVILGSLFPPWSDDSRGACGMKTGNPWYGVKCSEDGEHVEILCLAGVGLNTSLPSLPFSSLLHLQILYDLLAIHRLYDLKRISSKRRCHNAS
jgi:hypothetical protein